MGDVAEAQREILARRGVRIVDGPIERVLHEDGKLRGVVVGGKLIERTGILVASLTPYTMKSTIGEDLGCERDEMGLYKVGEGNRTSVPGVYAAGDDMAGMHSVLAACYAGQVAGANAARDLLQASFME